MTTPLMLVCASGLAREVAETVRALGTHELVGIVDDNPSTHGTTVNGLRVLGGTDVLLEHPDVQLLLCAGPGRVRALITARLAEAGIGDDRYATIVDASVRVPASCVIGAGSIVLANCVLTTSVTLGRHVVAMPNVTFTHDNVIADFATFAAGVSLGGWVTVGNAAYLGMNTGVRERVRIGASATIGMGSVVLTDVPDGETWYGVPAARGSANR